MVENEKNGEEEEQKVAVGLERRYFGYTRGYDVPKTTSAKSLRVDKENPARPVDNTARHSSKRSTRAVCPLLVRVGARKPGLPGELS